MSQENVEIVLGVFEAFGRRDTDAMFAAYDPDVEWSMKGYTHWPESETYSGHEGIRAFFRAWLKDFDRYETEASDPLDRGDKVVITVYDCARGKGSGVPIERYHAQVWTLRDGRVMRVEVFDDRRSALQAVGLSEQDAHGDSS
jgi:ketosteroid isomerase-like protein